MHRRAVLYKSYPASRFPLRANSTVGEAAREKVGRRASGERAELASEVRLIVVAALVRHPGEAHRASGLEQDLLGAIESQYPHDGPRREPHVVAEALDQMALAAPRLRHERASWSRAISSRAEAALPARILRLVAHHANRRPIRRDDPAARTTRVQLGSLPAMRSVRCDRWQDVRRWMKRNGFRPYAVEPGACGRTGCARESGTRATRKLTSSPAKCPARPRRRSRPHLSESCVLDS